MDSELLSKEVESILLREVLKLDSLLKDYGTCSSHEHELSDSLVEKYRHLLLAAINKVFFIDTSWGRASRFARSVNFVLSNLSPSLKEDFIELLLSDIDRKIKSLSGPHGSHRALFLSDFLSAIEIPGIEDKLIITRLLENPQDNNHIKNFVDSIVRKVQSQKTGNNPIKPKDVAQAIFDALSSVDSYDEVLIYICLFPKISQRNRKELLKKILSKFANLEITESSEHPYLRKAYVESWLKKVAESLQDPRYADSAQSKLLKEEVSKAFSVDHEGIVLLYKCGIIDIDEMCDLAGKLYKSQGLTEGQIVRHMLEVGNPYRSYVYRPDRHGRPLA